MSEPEDALAFQLRALGIPFEREVVFAKPRRWRLDFLLHSPTDHVAVEVDGGSWTGGRHTTGTGFQSDCDKLNEAMLMGYRVLRVTPAMVDDGRAVDLIERALR